MILCRENQMWWSLAEDEKTSFLQKQIKKSYDILYGFIWLLATCSKLSPTDSLSVINKAEELNDLITDGKQYNIDSWGN